MALIHISKDPPNQTPLTFTYTPSFIYKSQNQMMWIPWQDRESRLSFYRYQEKIPGMWSYAESIE